MKVLKDLGVEHDSNYSEYTNGTIQNETELLEGTPVIREIYGDILTNLYRLLEITGTVPTGTEDSNSTQFQIVDSLRLLTNELNDKEQVLTLSTLVWSVPFDLSILPDKYVFFAIATDDFDPTKTYTFKGTGVTPTYQFSSPGFNASDELIVIIDQSTVRVLSLSKLIDSGQQEFNVFGIPLSFNDTSVTGYNTDGSLLRDDPKIDDLRNVIRTVSTDSLLEIQDMVIIQDKVLCFCWLPSVTSYAFYQFSLSNLSVATLVVMSGLSIPTGVDSKPYMYTDGSTVYLTNTAGNSVNDYDISTFSYSGSGGTLTFLSSFSINVLFEKTTNVVIQGDFLYTFIANKLRSYGLLTGLHNLVDDFKSINGNIFSFNGCIYYSNGEVAIKWIITP